MADESLNEFEREQLANIQYMESQRGQHLANSPQVQQHQRQLGHRLDQESPSIQGLVSYNSDPVDIFGQQQQPPGPPQGDLEMQRIEAIRQNQARRMSELQHARELDGIQAVANQNRPNQGREAPYFDNNFGPQERPQQQANGENQPQDERTSLTAQKENLIKRMTLTILMDVIILAVILGTIVQKANVTQKCSDDLFRAGLVLCLYNVFFVIRNICICTICYYTKNPLLNSTLSRLTFVCIDCIAYTVVVIWATIKLGSDESSECKEQSEDIESYWWMVVALLIIGYIQMFIEWLICLVISCISCFFCCFYCRMAREQRQNALAQFQQHAPLMSQALNSLRPRKFSELSSRGKEAKDCVICYESFNQTDEVAQLNCDERHVFHKACLEQWMKSDTTRNTLKCPVCRAHVGEPASGLS